MDKTGFAIGNIQQRKGMIYWDVIATAAGRRAHALQAKQARGEWVASIECITAKGKVLEPLVIFKGKTVNQAWMLGDVDRGLTAGWQYAASLKGWSNNKLGYQWLRDVFDPQTHLPAGKHCLLILNGHGRHISARFCQYCYDHNINLLLLPPHTLHDLQPLGVGIFKELKKTISLAAEGR
jgi:hypothetical protein